MIDWIDMDIIVGVYPVKPPLPAVGGNEGVGRIEEVLHTLSFPISIL